VVGQANELETQVPALIEADAQDRLRSFGEQAGRDGRVIARVPVPSSPGYFSAPTVVTDLPAESPILSQELFGPLLAVERVRDVERACEIVERLPYALTGGLFARDPSTVRRVAARTPVGNLYVNRAITGAIGAATRSAATDCPGPARRPAAPIISCRSSNRARSARTRCVTDSRSERSC
jgi:RHH-type proline utilization regulon transcriptional repressor/proline dehydrogenase/delta 1-pyrroline-5-carboxylate dehydrogenase